MGAIYALLASALEVRLPVARAARLSLVSLFVTNSLPSAGLSGNVFLWEPTPPPRSWQRSNITGSPSGSPCPSVG